MAQHGSTIVGDFDVLVEEHTLHWQSARMNTHSCISQFVVQIFSSRNLFD